MACYSDFSQILGLMDIQQLYEEQQEKWSIRLTEKDERIEALKQDIGWRKEQVENASSGNSPADQEIAKLEEEKARVSDEARQRVEQLTQRLNDLTARMGG